MTASYRLGEFHAFTGGGRRFSLSCPERRNLELDDLPWLPLSTRLAHGEAKIGRRTRRVDLMTHGIGAADAADVIERWIGRARSSTERR